MRGRTWGTGENPEVAQFFRPGRHRVREKKPAFSAVPHTARKFSDLLIVAGPFFSS
ncbi:Uncharacterized protein dnm_000120 [Desulfonema magnum]|uniref:Uncharacterized protein n=1 Tax=Desulfonema magnum TaxID=45655 RepID=A0A975BEX1_9BACT|nr:Uncharacterized protein dnm_000120 [Desulfonema magnum]